MLLDIQAIVAKQLNKNAADVRPELTFAAIGADDLDLVEITMTVEDTFGILIRDDALATAAGRTDASALCTHLTIREFATVAESSPKQPPPATQIETVDDGTLRESQVGTYGQLAQLLNPNGLVLVFIPSLEELTTYSEQRLGRKMDDQKLDTLRQSAAVIALPSEMAEKLKHEKSDRELAPRK